MRFLVDNALSPKLATALLAAGHDAVHVLELGMETASDEEIIHHAFADERVIISADADFSRILVLKGQTRPSLLFLRGQIPRRVQTLAEVILRRLPMCESSLELGAIVVIRKDRMRIRDLPMSHSE